MEHVGEELPIAVMIHDDNGEPPDALVVVEDQPPRFAAARAARAAARAEVGPIEGRAAAALARHAMRRPRSAERLSSFLYDLIRQDCTCTSVLSGWSLQDEGCCRIVDHCRNSPEQRLYMNQVSGRTPLHEACLRGSCVHVIRALLEGNAQAPMERDLTGNTALHLLFVDFSTRSTPPVEMDEIVQLLLQANPTFIAAAVNESGCTALHMACSAPETMVHSSSLQRILTANSACASILNNRNQCALTLHCQRRNASTEVATILCDAYPGAMHVVDSEQGWTPFHYACFNSNANLIRFFLERDPDATDISASGNLRTGLHVLCQQQPTELLIPTLQAMVRAAPDTVTRTDVPCSYSPLHIICKSPRISLEVVRLLVDAMPQVAGIPDAEHYLPLHHACEVGAPVEVISYLLSAYPLGASTLTRKHDTPLSLACACNKSVDTVRRLIKANQHALEMKNDYGFAPLHCACRAYQPRMGIVQALLEASPTCIQLRTNAGETPVHVACANPGTYVGVLQLLSVAQNKAHSALPTGHDGALSDQVMTEKNSTSKVGNTPLHEACFRGSPYEHIETLAMSNPEWIVIKNNAGYSPFQILCKNGRIDERIVTIFSRIGGPEVFSAVDSTGNTPLHSAVREGIDAASIRCLIRAFPDALNTKTWPYGNSPLHLACFRRASADVVREIALASSDGRVSAVLEQNTAGLSPMSIAMDEFQSVFRSRGQTGLCCCVKSPCGPEQKRAFEVLTTLVKILFYGTGHDEHGSLVMACVSLHRQGVRLDPCFIRRAIQQFPEEVRMMDEHGNYPLHIEASIPVEKMSLLDSSSKACCSGNCHQRLGILRLLLETYPEATRARTTGGEFPLGLMIQNGRSWNQTFSLALSSFPPALHWHGGMDDDLLLPFILERVSKECGLDTMYTIIVSRPDIV